MNLNRTIKSILTAAALLMAFHSCGVLSDGELARIENLALKADTVASVPSVIFGTMAQVRLERGLFYAASFSTPEARFDEVNALAKASIEDKKRSAKADTYIGILNSYFKALRSIADKERWEGAGRELRGLGRAVDSLIIEHNELFDTEIPEGVSKTAGKTFGYLAEHINKLRQTRYVKEFVAIGDTLVAECTDSLMAILKSKSFNELIENETAGLEANYKAYLFALSAAGYPPQIAHDREYVALTEKISTVKQIRNRAVSALRSVKNAHHKLYEDLGEEDLDQNVYDEFVSLNRLALEIGKQIKTLEK